jgi:hypothetical protein
VAPGYRDVNTAGVIQRNQSHALPAPPRAGATAEAGSFAAAMAAAPHSVLPTVPSGKGAQGSAAVTQTQPTPQVASAYRKYIGRSTGTGQCVALVHATNPALGATSCWVRGAPVQGNARLRPGTAIATFAPSGRYANATDGSSHTAVYLGQTAHGIQVLDQWAGKPAAVRTIPWRNPGAAAANTGGAFHVVNSTQTRIV